MDLEKLEREAYSTRSDSGVLDVVIGAGLLGYGLLARMGAYLVPTCCLLLALMLDRLVVVPRVGRVRFSADRRARERAGVLLIALIVLVPIPVGLVLFFADRLASWTGFIATHATLVAGLFVGLGMAAVGWARSADRFYIYSIAALLSFAGAQFFGQHHLWPMIGIGAPILAVGIALVVRFCARNPVKRVEAA
jgi:hypothetical protein